MLTKKNEFTVTVGKGHRAKEYVMCVYRCSKCLKETYAEASYTPPACRYCCTPKDRKEE